MNLEELKIKISIDMKDLNKQLKGITDSMEKSFDASIKKMTKNTNKEVSKLSKDINKTLSEGFTINTRKFNQELNRTMNQAKRTVKQACSEIHREIESALNANGKIRVTVDSSTSGKIASSGSNSNASNLASAQYIGAMIVKSTNAMISNNNANTNRIISELNKVSNNISKLSKSLGKEIIVKTEVKQPKAYKVKAPKTTGSSTSQNGKGFTLGDSFDLSPVYDVIKEIHKMSNRIKRETGSIQLGAGSYGSNALEGGKVNFSMPGEVIDPIKVDLPELQKAKEIIEDVTYKVLDDMESSMDTINTGVEKVKKGFAALPSPSVLALDAPKESVIDYDQYENVISLSDALQNKLNKELSNANDSLEKIKKSLIKVSEHFRGLAKATEEGTIDDEGFKKQIDIINGALERIKVNDIKNVSDYLEGLKEKFGSKGVDTSGIDKMISKLKDLQDANTKLKGVSTRASKGKGIDLSSLQRAESLVKNAGNVKYGTSSPDSLGFMANKQDLNDLVELAKIAANKMKEAFAPVGSYIGAMFDSKVKPKLKEFGAAFKSQFKNLGKDVEFDVKFSALDKLKEKIKSLSDTSQQKKIKIDVDAGIEKVKTSLNKAKSALNKFVDASKTMWSKITGIFKKGANDAAASTNKLKTSISDLIKAGIGLMSLQGLINFTKQAAQASMTQADAELRLTAALKQRLKATDKTIESVRDLIDAQVNTGVLGKDVVTMGAQQLATYTQSKEALEALIPVMNNLLVKQEGIYASAEQAKEMAVRLGEALAEGSLEPLRSADIPITDAEVEAFKNLKTEAERTAFIMDLVAARVGNINQALAQTPYGAIAQLRNNFKSLLGTLGTFLVNVLQPIVTWLNGIVVACNNALKALGKLLGFDMSGGSLSLDMGGGSVGGGSESNPGSYVEEVTDAYKDAEDAADKATKANKKYKGSLMGFDELNILSNPNNDSDSGSDSGGGSGSGGTSIPAMSQVGELVEGDSPFDKFSEKMKAFIDEILTPFIAAWDILGERWKSAWADLKDSFKNFCDSLADFLVAVWENGGQAFVRHMAEIGLACGIAAMEIGGTILDSLAKLWEHLTPPENANTQGFLDALNQTAIKLRDLILDLNTHFESLMNNGGQDVLNALGDCFMNLGEAAARGVGVVIDAISGLLDHTDASTNEITQGMLAAWEGAFLAIGQAALEFATLLEDTLAYGGQDVVNAFGDAFNSLVGLVGTVTQELAQALDGLFEHLNPKTNEFTQGMLNAWEDAFNNIADLCSQVGTTLGSAMDNGGQELVNSLGDLAMQISEFAATIVGEIAECMKEFFAHLDPSTNDIAKGALDAFKYLTDSITGFVDTMGESLSLFMDKGGQAFVNNLGDITLLLLDLGATLAGDLISSIDAFFDSWIGQTTIELCARALELFSEVIKGLLEIIEPFTPILSGLLGAFLAFKGISAITPLIQAFAGIFTALQSGGILTLLQGGFSALWGVIVANPIAATVAVIAGIGVALVACYEKCEWFRDGVDAILEAFSGTFEAIRELCSEVLEDITNIFKNIIDIIVGIFTGDGERVGEALRELFGNLLKLAWDLVTGFAEIGVNLITAIIEGLWEGLKLAYTAIKNVITGLGEFIVDVFKGFFGINSPSKVFKGFGGDLIDGLIDGIKNGYNNVKNALKDLGNTIVNAAKDAVTKTVDKFKDITSGVKEKLSETKTVVSNKWEEIKTVTKEKTDALKKNTEENYNSMKDKLQTTMSKWSSESSNKWEEIKTATREKTNALKQNTEENYNKLRENLTNTLQKWRESSSEKWENIKSKTSEITSKLKTESEETYNKMKESLTNTMQKWSESSSEKWEKIRTTANEKVTKLKSESEEKYSKMKETLTNTMQSWFENSKTKWEAIKTNASENVENLKKDTQEKYNKMKESLTKTMQEWSDSSKNKWDNIKSNVSEVISKLKEDVTTKYGQIKKNLDTKMDEVKSSSDSKWSKLVSSSALSASSMVTKIKTNLSKLTSTITDPVEKAKTNISNIVSKIANCFKNVNWKLPNIPLPHIKVTGEWGFNPPSWPKFSIKWYKRGGIIDGLTPLGVSGGSMHMAGEAGKELVMPLENTSFTSKIAMALGQAVDNAIARNNNNMNNNAYNTMNDNRDIVLKINDREFARASINSINRLQRESGRTLLQI